MKKTNLKNIFVHVFSGVFLLFACFYMYDFYKCLSGFIANGFREPLVMLPLILSFFLPVVCFLFFFYDFYIKSVCRVSKIIYSSLVIIYATVNLVFIFKNISLYVSNAGYGVYDSLPSIIVHFPYDMIIVHSALVLLQIFNIVCAIKKELPPIKFILNLKQNGFLKAHVIEYLIYSVIAILAFVFTGSGITAIFTSFANAFYDFRFVYLILWVALIPLLNLVFLVVKPERFNISKRAKLITLGAGILVNLVFGILFLVFELTYPDFIVHMGKPLFLVAFSISLPIEMGIILGIMAVGTIAMITKMILVLIKKRQRSN